MAVYFFLRKGQTPVTNASTQTQQLRPAIEQAAHLTVAGIENQTARSLGFTHPALSYAERYCPNVAQYQQLKVIQAPRNSSLLGLAIPYVTQALLTKNLKNHFESETLLRAAVLERPDAVVQRAHQRAEYRFKRVNQIESASLTYRRLRRNKGKQLVIRSIHRLSNPAVFNRIKGRLVKRRALMPATRFRSRTPIYGRLIRKYQQRYLSRLRFRKSRRKALPKYTWGQTNRRGVKGRKPKRRHLTLPAKLYRLYHVVGRTHTLTRITRPLYWRERKQTKRQITAILLRFKPYQKLRSFAHGLWFVRPIVAKKGKKLPLPLAVRITKAQIWTTFMYNRTVPKESIEDTAKLALFADTLKYKLTTGRHRLRKLVRARNFQIRRRRSIRRTQRERQPKLLKRYKKFYNYKNRPLRLLVSEQKKLRRIRTRTGMEFLTHFGFNDCGTFIFPKIHQRPQFNPKRVQKNKQRKLAPKKWMKILTRLAGRQERTGKATRIARVAAKAVTASIMYMAHWVRNRDRRYRNRMRRLYKRYHAARQIAELYSVFNTAPVRGKKTPTTYPRNEFRLDNQSWSWTHDAKFHAQNRPQRLTWGKLTQRLHN